MITNLKYRITPGHTFEKLIIIKDRRAHRIRKATTASSVLKDPNGFLSSLTTEISYEGGVVLSLLPSQTQDLEPGDYSFDVVADPWGYSQTVAQGTITVDPIDRITPLEGGFDMIIQFYQGTDFRQNYTWTDSAGDVLAVSDARLQAVDAQDAVVLDLSFYPTAPDETTIGLMDPDKRGYLAPGATSSLEMHVSEKAVIAPGDYAFDLKVQETSTGDWDVLSSGTIRVVKSITDQTAP